MSGSNISVDEMWKKLEHCGIKREMLEKLHPSPETLLHIYSSIKNQKT
ncbi:MAG TPA: hypothetical protein VJ771_07740 [Candidatus Nitrosotalea sp.]|nr:hypothetical protein [Candidatus Nitrosotalea sp.]